MINSDCLCKQTASSKRASRHIVGRARAGHRRRRKMMKTETTTRKMRTTGTLKTQITVKNFPVHPSAAIGTTTAATTTTIPITSITLLKDFYAPRTGYQSTTISTPQVMRSNRITSAMIMLNGLNGIPESQNLPGWIAFKQTDKGRSWMVLLHILGILHKFSFIVLSRYPPFPPGRDCWMRYMGWFS